MDTAQFCHPIIFSSLSSPFSRRTDVSPNLTSAQFLTGGGQVGHHLEENPFSEFRKEVGEIRTWPAIHKILNDWIQSKITDLRIFLNHEALEALKDFRTTTLWQGIWQLFRKMNCNPEILSYYFPGSFQIIMIESHLTRWHLIILYYP